MARTKVFVSSTSKDLRDVRASVREHIRNLGHEVVAFESPDFSSNPSKDTCEACLNEVRNSDVLILILDRRYGARYKGSNKSFTRLEYDTARAKGIPIFVLVSSEALIGRQFYLDNGRPRNMKWGVDDPDLFDFIDEIEAQPYGNWVQRFSTLDEIKTWISGQLSSLLRDCLLGHYRPPMLNRVEPHSPKRMRHVKAAVAPDSRSSRYKFLQVFNRMKFSYKAVLFLALWRDKNVTSIWSLEDAVRAFQDFYLNRLEKGEVPEHPSSEMHRPELLSGHALMRVVSEGPLDALRGHLIETQGAGATMQISLTPDLVNEGPEFQAELVRKAEEELRKYFARLQSQAVGG